MNSPHVNRLLVAKGLRAFGDGYVSLLLPVYLLELGYSPLEVGIIATATLLGIFIIPVFYVLVQSLQERLLGKLAASEVRP